MATSKNTFRMKVVHTREAIVECQDEDDCYMVASNHGGDVHIEITTGEVDGPDYRDILLSAEDAVAFGEALAGLGRYGKA